MKPFLWFILLLNMASLNAFAQFAEPDSAFNIPEQILITEKNIPVVDGRNVQRSARYALTQALDWPLKKQDLQVIRQDNKPIYIEKKKSGLKSEAVISPEDQFYRFLDDTGYEMKINNPRESFRIKGVQTDKLGITHIRAVQHHQGIEVYGSETILHVDEEKERLTGRIHEFFGDIAEPKITNERACEVSIRDLKLNKRYRELSAQEKEILKYDAPSSALFLMEYKGSYVPVWLVTLRPNFFEEWKYFIHAETGDVIRKFNNTQYDGPAIATGTDLNNLTRSFNVYIIAGIYYMYDITQRMFNQINNEGIIITLDANNTSTLSLDYTYVTSVDNIWTQKAAISAHCNATKTYQYFDTTFNRNSINGKGGNIISMVNVVHDDGSPMENAFWNGQVVFYGNGGSNIKPVAGALDVTAHELTHGMISSTSNLEYFGQSGAINESFADIFACMVDRNDWQIGEDIVNEGYIPSGVLRDLSDPHNGGDSSNFYWQPAHTSEMYLGSHDNFGVHVNSGICNYAYYLFAEKVGKARAEQVFYRALTEYLTKTSGFIDLRIAVVQSARDLYGDYSEECFHAGQSFESVGIYEETPVDIINEFDPNPGEQMLLTYDTNPSDPVTLYQSSAQGTNYRPLTNTPMIGKVSVTDDGKTAVFVSNERRIRMINTGYAEVNERVISDYGYYDRVAISKDGMRLATTKLFTDASIYVYNMATGEGRQFLLYNPTTSQVVDAGGVMKAYSLEFDITGEYLIYGANNVINSNTQKDIYYWDIGFIKVWDNEKEDFSDGFISKLYSTLPLHVNLGNPVFSKNSPSVIAFDYFYDDGVLEEYAVYTANIQTGLTGKITANDRLGYPSFSNGDDRIAYSAINGSNQQVVKYVMLSGNKLSSAHEPGVLVPDAKWPVFYTSGNRALGLPPVSNFTSDYKYGDFPLTSRFLDLSMNKPSSWLWSFEGGDPATSVEQNPLVTFENPGFYKVTLITQNAFGSDTLIREKYIHAIDPVGVGDEFIPEFSIYPNPFGEAINITGPSDSFTIRIFSLEGIMVAFSQKAKQLNLSHLKPGIYLMELQTEKSSFRQKLVKQ